VTRDTGDPRFTGFRPITEGINTMTIPSHPTDAPSPGIGELIPVPEPDAYRHEIPDQPDPGETGAEAFGRDIAREVALRLPPPLTGLLYRENPWDRRPCTQAQFYDITISGHHIRITTYQAPHPRYRETHTVFAISLDGQPIPFDRIPIDPLPRQIAYAIWDAHLDQPDHPHPIPNSSSDADARPVDPR
jgi:hypothetical protein